jgi:hypothetical protein
LGSPSASSTAEAAARYSKGSGRSPIGHYFVVIAERLHRSVTDRPASSQRSEDRRSVATNISNEALRQAQDLRQQSSPTRGYARQELRGIYPEGINLKKLYLWETAVSDLSVLANLTNLELLFVDETLVADLGPLSGLSELQTLCVFGIYWRKKFGSPILNLRNWMRRV